MTFLKICSERFFWGYVYEKRRLGELLRKGTGGWNKKHNDKMVVRC